ncbi:alpha/beta fold hydrolase [Streptomyces sp. NPDC018019]|uniref:alpha/beta fold hydrolase n=1 Tax=Streptomyces sp. NPDC018019 TaxID=3365030 RepID=UPI00378B3A11
MRAEGGADRRTRLQHTGRDGRTLVFVHGFLDDKHVWDDVIRELKTQGVRTVQLDLAGLGERTDADGPFVLDRFAADVAAVMDALDTPVVLVGQSMAAPIVELVAATHSARTLGLALVTPVPLAGTRLPDEAVEPFRALGGDPQAQRAVRQQLSSALAEADLDRLTAVGARVRPEVVRALADCWNTGHPDGRRPSRYQGPVLVIQGADDGFITEGLVTEGVLRRFGSIESATVDGAGHWVHVERPAAVAALLDVLLATAHPTDNPAQDARP